MCIFTEYLELASAVHKRSKHFLDEFEAYTNFSYLYVSTTELFC